MSEDCTELSSLSLDTIIDNLSERYDSDKIYTYTGNVLLAVNPYKVVSGPADPLVYRGRSFRANAPHPFALADAALRSLLGERRSQALVISGESGAGKTETARLILQYFTQLGEQNKIGNPEMIGNLVSQSTEILEAFGNAATSRNLNSSRFGKFQKLFFRSSNKFPIFLGSLIQPFLLETSRVPCVSAGEKNFHIFYQLLAGLSDTQLQTLGIFSRNFRLFPMLGAHDLSSEDAVKWTELQTALEFSGFSETDRKFLIHALAGILHLSALDPLKLHDPYEAAQGSLGESLEGSLEGSISESVEESVTEHSSWGSYEYHMKEAGRLLGLENIEKTFSSRQVMIGNRENYSVDRTATESEILRRSLMRSTYSKIFEFVNRKFCRISDPSENFIGCLDIFGFEKFPINGLEQLLINLVNEKLQEFFLDKVIEGERRALLAEGLTGVLSVHEDATGSLRVREISRVLEILDDHCLRRAKQLSTSDEKFGQNIHAEFFAKSDIICATKKRENLKFLVKHFAGEVEYEVTEWIDKNNDRKFPEIDQLLEGSTNLVISDPSGPSGSSGSSAVETKGNNSVRRKFQESAGSLLSTISECQSFFVRCVNPNDKQISDHFDRKYVGQQLTHSGTLDLVKVMREGFPCRQNLDVIYAKYGNLIGNFSCDKRMFAEVLMAHIFRVSANSYRVGLNTLFLKTGLMEISDQLEISDLTQEIRAKLVLRKFQRAVFTVRAALNINKQISDLRRKRRLLEIAQTVLYPIVLARRFAKVAIRNFRLVQVERAQAAKEAAAAAAEAAAATQAEAAAAAAQEAAEAAAEAEAAQAEAAEAAVLAAEAAAEAAAAEAAAKEAADAAAEAAKAAAEAAAAEAAKVAAAEAEAEAATAAAQEAEAQEASAQALLPEVVAETPEEVSGNISEKTPALASAQSSPTNVFRTPESPKKKFPEEISVQEKRVHMFAVEGGRVVTFERGTSRFQDENGNFVEFPIKRSFWSVAEGEQGTFAAADRENTVVVWKFLDSSPQAKFSIHPKGGEASFQTRHVKFYDLKFLCLVVEQAGKKYPVPMITPSPRDFISRFAPPPKTATKEITESQFYMILLEVGKNSKFSVHSTIAIGISATQTLPQTVAFLEISGNFLVAGGRGCLQFMQVRKSSETKAVAKLEMIGNQNSFRDLSACSFTCALFIDNAVFIGCTDGNIYRFVLDENGHFVSEECGRLRQGDDGLSGKRIVALVRKFAEDAPGFLAFTACGRVDEWSEKSDGRWARIATHGRVFKHITNVKETSDQSVAIFDGKSKTLFSFEKRDASAATIHKYSQ